METERRKGWIVAAFGRRPRQSTKYRLPLSIAILVSFIVIVVFGANRGLDDAAFLAFGVYIACDSLGDRAWSISVRAAAWLRLIGVAVLLAGAAALAAHLYIERSWILLILALLVISVAIIFWVQTLGDRIQGASENSTPE